MEAVRRELRGVAIALVLVAATTIIALALTYYLDVRRGSVIYLLPVLLAGWHLGLVPALVAAVGGVLWSGYFFYSPNYIDYVARPIELINLVLFTIVAVVSLALGIGLNTAIFSIVNVILIRPVPMVKEQSRVVWLRAPISYPDYVDYREQTQSFAGMAAVTGTSEFSLALGGEPELIKGEYVTENYFDVLRVGALTGRTFIKEEGQTPAPVVVVTCVGAVGPHEQQPEWKDDREKAEERSLHSTSPSLLRTCR